MQPLQKTAGHCLLKLDIHLPDGPALQFLGIYSRETPTYVQWRTWKRILMVAVLTRAKPGNDPKANH